MDDLGIDPFRGVEISDVPSLLLMAHAPLELPMMALRALVPLPQTVKGDLAIGIHIEWTLFPPDPIPLPVPVVFLGGVDTTIAEMLGGGSRVALPGSAPDGGADNVAVRGVPATAAGKKCRGMHLLLPAIVQDPFGDAELLMGSASVDIGGRHAVRLGELAMGCSFPVRAPTTRVLSLRNVVTGGASVIDPGAAGDFVINAFLEPMLGKWGAAYARQVHDTLSRASDGGGDISDVITSDPFEALEEVAQDWAPEL